jgi:hypothetical protein
MTEHEIQTAAAESGVPADVLIGYVLAGISLADAVRQEREIHALMEADAQRAERAPQLASATEGAAPPRIASVYLRLSSR